MYIDSPKVRSIEMIYEKERELVAAFMRRLYRQFLTTTSGGNISCRLPDGNIAVTASQSDKANQQAETVGVVTPDGETLTPELKLSIETGLHLAIYRVRPDVGAIVHAHPVTATFFTSSVPRYQRASFPIASTVSSTRMIKTRLKRLCGSRNSTTTLLLPFCQWGRLRRRAH